MGYLLKKELSTTENYKDNVVLMLIFCKIIRDGNPLSICTSQSFLDARQLYVGQRATKLKEEKRI